MEKVSWNTVNKKQNGLEQIENENIKAWLKLEPNFPGVATPQNSLWIIYIISYAYDPFTAPWGGCLDNMLIKNLLKWLTFKGHRTELQKHLHYFVLKTHKQYDNNNSGRLLTLS